MIYMEGIGYFFESLGTLADHNPSPCTVEQSLLSGPCGFIVADGVLDG
jgi:hypothetical protein